MEDMAACMVRRLRVGACEVAWRYLFESAVLGVLGEHAASVHAIQIDPDLESRHVTLDLNSFVFIPAVRTLIREAPFASIAQISAEVQAVLSKHDVARHCAVLEIVCSVALQDLQQQQ